MPVSLASLGTPPAEAAGQLWLANEIGGHMYHSSPLLSKKLRMGTRKRARFRQFCDLPDSEQVVKHEGDTFTWNVHGQLESRGRRITELEDLPSTRGQVERNSVTVTEWGNSVYCSRKLLDFASEPVEMIVKKNLEYDCALTLDLGAYEEYARTPIKIGPAGGTSTTEIAVNTNGTPVGTVSQRTTLAHVRAIVRRMSSDDRPTYDHGDYYGIARPDAFITIDEELEQINRYTETGLQSIREGEKGRYAGCRFIHQTAIDEAAPFAGSDAAEMFFFGQDPVTEAMHTAEEVQTAISSGFGRNRRIGWFYVGEFAQTYPTAANSRIYHLTSA